MKSPILQRSNATPSMIASIERRDLARALCTLLFASSCPLIGSEATAEPGGCDLDCQVFRQPEPCGADLGICTMEQLILDGPWVCGSNWASDGLRDSDALCFTINETMTVQLELRAAANSVAFIAELSGPCTCPVTGIPKGTLAYSGNCDLEHILGEYLLSPGDYLVSVGIGNPDGSAIFEGYPCVAPDGHRYEVRLRTSPGPCVEDLNGDGNVNGADLLTVVADWGPCPATCPTDLDGDDDVGFADLLRVLAVFGARCQPQ